MNRYTGAVRIRLTGDLDEAQRNIPRARVVLGELEKVLQGATTGYMRREVLEGVHVTASFHDGLPNLEIYVVPRIRRDTFIRHNLWVPSGFVLYPASDDAPTGWGLPVVTSGDDLYAAVNLNPGLDLARWTVGGPLGQVLLTKQVDCGYPKITRHKQPVPMYANAEGPHLDRYHPAATTGLWSAYRIRLEAFDGGDETAFRRKVFELVNGHRAGIGRDQLSLPPYGRFDSAQSAAEIMASISVIGHFWTGFPKGYRRAEDRGLKDGIPSPTTSFVTDYGTGNAFENAVGYGNLPIVQIGTDPNGTPIYQFPNGLTGMTAQEAFDGWLASPPHRAAIEYEGLDTIGDRTGVTMIGKSGGAATQHFFQVDQWVQCGNRSWHSKHPEIPPLTWHGFPSLNLAWETLPAVPNPVQYGQPLETPFSSIRPFAYRKSSGGVEKGFAIPTVGTRWSGDDPSPSMSGAVYMRGRLIALAPNAGIVWAAAVQKVSHYPDPPSYKIVILTHHIADQPGGAEQTANLRVWWVDIPQDWLFAANPPQFIRGEHDAGVGFPYGEEGEPYTWHGGDLVDVGTSDGVKRDLLKYDSQWVFDSEGLHAICLRSLGELADYSPLMRARTYPGEAREFRQPFSVSVELDLTGTPSVAVRGFPAAYSTSTACESLTGAWFNGYLTAAGFDKNDNPKWAFLFYVDTSDISFDAIPEPRFALFGFSTDYDWIPACQWRGSDELTLYHTSTLWNEGDTGIHGVNPAVIDVLDEVVVATGTPPKYIRQQAGDDGLLLRVPNPAYRECWKNLDEPYVEVWAWRKGVLLGVTKHSNPDDMVPASDVVHPCVRVGGASYISTVVIPECANPLTICTYATNGDDWMLNYTLTPQQWALYANIAGGYTCWANPCRPTWADISRYVEHDPRQVRGGTLYSSLGRYNDIVDKTKTTGDNARFLYVRTV